MKRTVILIASLVLFAGPAAAFLTDNTIGHQSDGLDQRLSSAERTLNGIAGRLGVRTDTPVATRDAKPIIVAQSSRRAARLSLRMDNIEEQIRTLNGRVEDLVFQLQQMQDQLRRMQEDNEFRFQELEGGSAGAGLRRSDVPQPTQQTANASEPALPAPVPQSGNTVVRDDGLPADPNLAGTVRTLGTIPADSQNQPGGAGQGGPLDLTAAAGGGQGQVSRPPGSDVAALSTADPQTAYDTSYGHIVRGEYEAAEQGFRQFLASYPDHSLSPDARFWLGESLFVRGSYRDAADVFLETYTAYPSSRKAPDSLLRLGQSLKELNKLEAACATYTELQSKYPNVSDSIKQRVRQERSLARC